MESQHLYLLIAVIAIILVIVFVVMRYKKDKKPSVKTFGTEAPPSDAALEKLWRNYGAWIHGYVIKQMVVPGSAQNMVGYPAIMQGFTKYFTDKFMAEYGSKDGAAYVRNVVGPFMQWFDNFIKGHLLSLIKNDQNPDINWVNSQEFADRYLAMKLGQIPSGDYSSQAAEIWQSHENALIRTIQYVKAQNLAALSSLWKDDLDNLAELAQE